MKAVILAGGEAKRLKPISDTTPKCLLEVGGKTIIQHQLDAITACGIFDIVIVTGHQGEKVKSHLKNCPHTITFVDNTDYKTTNSVHGLWLTKDVVLEDPDGFLIFNGDLILTPKMIQNLLDADVPSGIVIEKPVPEFNDMVNVQMDGDRIIYMNRSITGPDVAAEAVGPIKMSRESGVEFFKSLEGRSTDWVFYLLGEFAQKHALYGVWTDGEPWAEIDTPEDLEDARKKFAPTAHTS